MKQLLILVALVGCGSPSATLDMPYGLDGCKNHPLMGVWQNATDTLTLDANCRGTSTRCGSAFVFNNHISHGTPWDYVIISVETTNGLAGCPPIGISSVDVSWNATQLAVTPDANVVPPINYTRIQ